MARKTGRSVNAANGSRRSRRSSDPHGTVDQILECGRRVLIEHGHVGFTTRRVAEAAAISLGNLTYHFPTKSELLRALVNRLVAEYSGQFDALLTDSETPNEQQIESLVRWLLTDAVTEETVRIFRELWAMSLHDEMIRQAVDDLYDSLMNGAALLLRRSRPDIDVKSIRELVQVLALLSEGSTVLFGTCRERVVPFERVIELVMPMLAAIVPDLRQPRSQRSQPGKRDTL